MIPKKIHYCWFGGKPLPRDVKKCIESWRKHAPEYDIIEWNESNFNVKSHPFMKKAYEAKAWAFVSDYARLKIIYDNGGIYFDTDVELLKNPDFLLENQCYIGVQQVAHLCATGLGFGAVKFNPIVKKMLEKYDVLEFSSDNKKELSCPYLNNSVIEELGYKYSADIWKHPMITVYPCEFFDPISPGNTENLMRNDTVSIHHYAGSWTCKRNKFKRKIFRFIGEENVHKLKKLLRK